MERMTPELRARVLALPEADREALRRELVESLLDPRDVRAVYGLEELRDEVRRIAGVDPLDATRCAAVVRARSVLAYAAHERGITHQELAHYLGLTRSTVIYGIRKMAVVLARPALYPDYFAIFNQLNAKIS